MIKFGVIGAGRIAATFSKAADGIQENLYAVASRDLAKAEEFAKKYGFEKAYGSYEEMLEDPLVDCVYIATPHGFHYEQMKLCLEKGKNILCEKAFTLNLAQAEEILAIAKEKNLFVMEAMWTRFLPTILEVKKMIDEDTIGEIFQIEGNFGFNSNHSLSDRLFNPLLGGGALLDIGIYPITLANLFLGIPDSFDTSCVFSETGVDQSNEIIYYYPEAKAVLKSSFMEDITQDAYIYGTKGYFYIPNFHRAEVATLYNNNHKVVRVIEHKHIVNGMEYEIFEVVKCLKKKQLESKVMPHETTLEIMRQMDEIRANWNLKYPQELE
ncbi:MAG: Gfo/Idh/MocA family protein [Candidatus Izemoplasmatales bacterium]